MSQNAVDAAPPSPISSRSAWSGRGYLDRTAEIELGMIDPATDNRQPELAQLDRVGRQRTALGGEIVYEPEHLSY
jgi:hypothetical protein